MLLADGDDDGDFLLDSIEMYNGLRWFGKEVVLLRYPETRTHGFTGWALQDFLGERESAVPLTNISSLRSLRTHKRPKIVNGDLRPFSERRGFSFSLTASLIFSGSRQQNPGTLPSRIWSTVRQAVDRCCLPGSNKNGVQPLYLLNSVG